MSRLVIALLVSFALGGGTAWKVQGTRLDAVQTKFDGFVAQVTADGAIAKTLAEAAAAKDKREKELSDHEYEIRIAGLTADNKRLLNARSSTRYVPAAPVASVRPDIACFDRANLERALRQFDEATSGLIGEGDADAVALNVAREWALHSRANTPPHDLVNSPP